MNKHYIGDGVYIEVDDNSFNVILTTENGISVTNRIVLEIRVLKNMNEYLRRQAQLLKMDELIKEE